MPPKGVTVLAECVHEWQAQMVVAAYEKGQPPPLADQTLVLGEDPSAVFRARKTPVWWNAERWPRESLMWEAEDEADVPF